MISTIVRRSIIVSAVAGFLIIGGLGYIKIIILPKMEEQRQTIDDLRASITVSQQQQSNLQALTSNIEEIKTAQADLNNHIWSFSIEEQFFDLWSPLANQHGVTIDQPNVAEVTPSNQPLARAVTVVVSGPVKNVMTTIEAIQKIDPVIAINKVSIENKAVNNIKATIEAQTLWQ